MSAFAGLLARDLRLSLRAGGGALMAVLFFLAVLTMLPLAVGPDLALLRRIGPAMLWVAALLANLLALDRLFVVDQDDGSLDLMLTAPLALELTVLAKGLAHWLATGLPLAIAVPLFGLLLDLEFRTSGTVAATLIAGTPGITFLGAIGAALAVTLRRGGLLLPILVLPLSAPVLIFGVAACDPAAPFGAAFMVLCALTLGSIAVAPFAAAAALRSGLE